MKKSLTLVFFAMTLLISSPVFSYSWSVYGSPQRIVETVEPNYIKLSNRSEWLLSEHQLKYILEKVNAQIPGDQPAADISILKGNYVVFEDVGYDGPYNPSVYSYSYDMFFVGDATERRDLKTDFANRQVYISGYTIFNVAPYVMSRPY